MNAERSRFGAQDFVAACLASGMASADDIARSERVRELQGGRIDQILNQLGIISDDGFVSTWSALADLKVASEADLPSEPVAGETLRPAFLRHAKVLPIAVDGKMLEIATADPLDAFSPAAIALKTGLEVVVRLARPQDIGRALDRLYGPRATVSAGGAAKTHASTATDLERLRDLASDAPVIKLVQSIIERAVEARASDIHLTVSRRGPLVKARIDGVLKPLGDLIPVTLYDAVISRIKILGGLDIAERRLPQDGSARIVTGGHEVDLRIATMPHFAGEGVVLRILDRGAVSLDFEQLGMSESFVAALKSTLDQPSGLVLMTGPTGSGKTTTLYAALRSMLRADRNLITIEDPVEYQLDGVTQIEINHRIGFDFAKALRAALRQDPDVVLVGEIRDGETAAIAARAALTGHLVLASVHTNSASAALPRLIDMGVEPYLLASTVRAVIAQRLVRRVCSHCALPHPIPAARLIALAVNGAELGPGPEVEQRGQGCEHCRHSGYKGRIAVTEFMLVDETLRAAIGDSIDVGAMEALAVSRGMRRLAEHGLDLVRDGRTTVDELDRVLGSGGD